MLGSGAGEKKPIKEVEMLCAHSTKLEGLNRATTEEALGVFNRFLEIANRHTEMSPLLREFVVEVQKLCSCSAIGIRLLDEEGNIPYEDYVGFSQNFYELESPLSIKSDKCMCINVIKGDTDPTLPFYTKGGSFYMNGTTKFLSHVTEEEKGQTRNVCNEIGYESVALVPIYYRERILGLIHIADHKENMVPLDIIEILEGVGMQLGTAMRRIQTEEALRASEERYRELFENAGEGIITLDLDGRITGANRLVEEYGFNRDDLIGRRLFDFVPEYDKARSVSDFEALIAGRRVQGQMDVITPKGIITVEYRDTPMVRAGEVIGVQAILTDITERKRAEERIELLGRILETSPISVIATDEKVKIIYVNPATENLFGYESEELIGKDPGILNAEPDADKMQMRVLDTIRQKRVWKGELLNKKKNGERFYIQVSCCQLLDEEGNFIALLGFQEDITERMKAKEALLREKDKAQQYLNVAGVMLVVIDAEQRVGLINKKGCEILGYKEEEILGKNWFNNFLPERIRGQVKAVFEKVIREEVDASEYYENPILTKSGGERLIAWHNTVLKDEKGNVIATLSSGEDITDRKRAEEALRESGEKFRSIFDNANDIIASVTKTGKILEVNKKIEDILGYKPDELIGKNFMTLGLLAAKNAAKMFHFFKESVKIGGFLVSRDGHNVTEVWVNHKDGHTVLLEANSTTIKEDGKLVGYLSVVRDITERKKAEEAYRSLVDHSLQGLAIFQNGRVVFTNQALADITGHTVEEMLAMSPEQVQAFVHPDDRELVWSRHRNRLNGEELTGRYEFRGIRKDGSTCWLELNANRIEYNGKPAIQAAYVDITERKKAEEELLESEERYRGVVEDTPVLICCFLPDGEITFANKTYCEYFNKSPEELVGSTLLSLIPEADRETVMANISALTVESPTESHENRVIAPSGELRWQHWTNRALFDAQGKTVAYQSIGEDITEHKKAEEALQESEEHYRMLAETMNDGLSQIDESGRFAYVNNKFGEILGYSPDEMVGRYWTDFYDEQAQKIIKEQLLQRKKGSSEPYELKNTRKDGQKIFIRISPQAIFDEDGKFKGSIKIITDITEQKKAEEQIAKLAKFPTENPNPVLRISGRGTVVFANNASANLLKAWDCSVGKSLPDRWNELVLDALSSGQNHQTEVQCDDRIFSLTFAPVVVANYVNVYGHDITERKKAEEMLLSERDRLISVFKAMEDGVYIVNQQHDIQYVNPVLEEDFGAWHNRKCYQYFHNREEVCPWCKNEEVFAGKTVRWEWYSFKNQKTYDLIDTPLKNLDGSISKLEIFRDISERKKTEEKLLEDQAKLKAMASEMLLTEEHERQRLAVGLHDSVCQKLVLTKLALESSLQLVSNSNVLASLRIVCEGIGETIEQADSLTFELSNPVLRQLGFVIALEKYLAEEIRQKHGIEYELEGDEQLSTLPDEIKNCLFRVTRELLTNVVKHAQARKVKVSARESQSQIYVRVQDDGVGFKESQAGAKVSQTARFGLFSIREQLEYLGGHLEIESEPGRGTKATVVVPLRDKATV